MAENGGCADETSDEVNFECVTRRMSVYLGSCSVADIVIKDDESEGERGENLEGWGVLPDIVIEKVFSYLDIPQKYSASLVCRQWQNAFYMQGSWNTFELEDTTLTRHKFNYYMGWQLILDHLRTQVCIFRIGRFIRNLVLSPMSNLFNLYEFMNLMSYYSERYKEDETSRAPLKIQSLRFIFRCDLATRQENLIYGTGGKLLEALQRLMGNLSELNNLELIDLLLDSSAEAIHLLDDVCAALCGSLERLLLINTTRAHLSLLHPACFVHLRILKISPQNIGTDIVELFCNLERLTELHLIQNDYTEALFPVDRHAWRKAKFKVYLRTVITKSDKEIIWQEKSPVVSVIYDSAFAKVNWASLLTVVDFYSQKLEEYGHLRLPKFGKSRKFEDRADGALVTLARKCPKLHTLYIREQISTSTVLLIAASATKLQNFYTRRNALILRCDYRNLRLELDSECQKWLRCASKSYQIMNEEVGRILEQPGWMALSDSKFKEICKNKTAY